MGHVVLWIVSLAVSLLFVAALTACIARMTSPRAQWVLWALVALAPVIVFGALTAVGGYLAFALAMSRSLFAAPFGLALCCAAGALAIGAKGLLPRDAGERPAAAWPRLRLAVALGVAVALWSVTLWNLDLAARQQMGLMRARAGTLALSVAPARVPDADNAAPLYEQAMEILGPRDAMPTAWGRWVRTLDDESNALNPAEAELDRFLDAKAPVLAMLRRAAEKRGCYFEHEYGHISLAMLLPEIDILQRASNLLALAARRRLAGGDIPGALADTRALFGMAEHAGDGPLLIGMLVATAVDRRAVGALQAALDTGKVPADKPLPVRLSDTVSYHRLHARALRMEEAAQLTVFAAMEDELANFFAMVGEQRAPPGFGMVYRVFLMRHDLAAHAWFTARYRKLAARPYHESRDEWESFGEEIDRAPRGLLTAIIVPTLSATAERAARGDAHRRLVRTAVALHDYRARHGKLPEKLADLAGESLIVVPADPYDGKCLRYRRTDAGGAVVYSVGPDLRDDRGAAFDSTRKTGDLTFRVPS